MATICFVLVGIGTLMILLGVYMSVSDWNSKQPDTPTIKEQGAAETITALGNLAEKIKHYPPGQQLIVWGIVILIIAGVFGGVGSLQTK